MPGLLRRVEEPERVSVMQWATPEGEAPNA